MIESERVMDAAFGTLSADTTLTGLLGPGNRIHDSVAPEGTAMPFVVLNIASAVDENFLDGSRVWQNTLLAVTVRGKGTMKSIRGALDRVDDLLQGLTATVDNEVRVVKLRREGVPTRTIEVENGVRYPALTQMYRTEAEPL